MLKDWKKVEKNKWQKRNIKLSIIKLTEGVFSPREYAIELKEPTTTKILSKYNITGIGTDHFKTRKETLKFAKAYMRRH